MMKNVLVRLLVVTAAAAQCFWSALRCDGMYPGPPRSLEQKVKAADLIVLGTATLFGKKDQIVTNLEYFQNVRLNVKAVLWPPSFTNTSDIVFRYYVYERWPISWWAYSNTPGVFFLVKGTYYSAGGWDRLEYYDDWMEPATNALTVLLAINRQKGETFINEPLCIPAVPWPWATRYDGDAALRCAYLIAFRKGYFDALANRNRLLMFSPSTEEDKARVLGFADGQLAGNKARRKWLVRLKALMGCSLKPRWSRRPRAGQLQIGP